MCVLIRVFCCAVQLTNGYLVRLLLTAPTFSQPQTRHAGNCVFAYFIFYSNGKGNVTQCHWKCFLYKWKVIQTVSQKTEAHSVEQGKKII